MGERVFVLSGEIMSSSSYHVWEACVFETEGVLYVNYTG